MKKLNRNKEKTIKELKADVKRKMLTEINKHDANDEETEILIDKLKDIYGLKEENKIDVNTIIQAGATIIAAALPIAITLLKKK
ncbi:hypothetical protein GJ23_gp26 [Lactococcus phage P118]|uniref:Uncharacterized protein n=1 Tax=Lactococcus phage P118 TaxID=1476888 RepID=X4YUQ5_9CAUD|nr:hypothetical protein GJ23_gp26 [Lactococcus phage P118]AHV83143.1 hypothetical protein P118_0026 [Lactococcus phage P118]